MRCLLWLAYPDGKFPSSLQKEHVFVVVEAGDELPVWQPPKCILAHTDAKADVDLLSQPFRDSSGNGGVITVRVEQ